MDKKRFRLTAYILPAVISMVVVGTNANIDGFFIGRILGDDGLAAINIAWPIVALIASLGTGLGIGGAVLLNRTRGEGDPHRAEIIKNTTLCLLLLGGVLSGAILYLFSDPLVALMGADGDVRLLAGAYAAVISAGAVLQVLAAGLVVLLRNDHRTYRSMIFSLVGLLLHILLNFLLADRYRMVGLALATVISQGAVALLCLLSLPIDRRRGPSIFVVPPILRDALAPFGINFVPSFVLLLTNFFALWHGGVAAVSAYAAMSYAVYTFDYIFQGICDGIQPIVSYCRGADDHKEEQRALWTAGIIQGSFALLCVLLTPLLVRFLPGLLGVSPVATEMMTVGLWLYALSYPFKAAVKFIGSYFYAAGQPLASSLIIYADPLLLTPLSLWLLTRLFGVNGLWLSLPITQGLLTVAGVAITIMLRHRTAERRIG